MTHKTWSITITVSKLFAFVGLAAGTLTSIWLKSAEVFIVTITMMSAIVANKQYQDRVKEIKKPQAE